MKANSKRKVFGDAVDLLMGDMEKVARPRGVQMVPVKNIQPFHDHPFHLYEGERLEDMIASVKEHGVLNPVIVQKLDTGYEMLSGHNRWNAAKLAGIKEIPAIVKTDLSEEEAYVYIIETNLMQRSFSDLAISEKAAVLKARYEKEACQGKRNDILEEIARLEGKEILITRGHDDHRLKTRDMIGKEYELSGSSVGRLLKLNDLIKPFKDIVSMLDELDMYESSLMDKLEEEKCLRKEQFDAYAIRLLTGENEGKEYENVELKQIAKFSYGYTDKAKDAGSVRFIRITDIDENGFLKNNDAKYIDYSEDVEKYMLHKGDIVMARTGATYGKTLYVPNDEPAAYASFLIKISFDNSIMDNKFYWFFTRTQMYWKQANKYVSTGGQPQFNTGAIGRVCVPVPPLIEQKMICEKLEKLDTAFRKMIALLENEILLRQKELAYYRKKLLS